MKYCIIGVAHHGTCSLEKYLVYQGHDVVRNEVAYSDRTVEQYEQLYPGYKPVIIINKLKEYNTDHIKKWEELEPLIIYLDEISKKHDFPWENKNDCYSKRGIRPVYKKP